MGDMVGKVNTVLGPVNASDLGIILPHEHVLVWLQNWYMEPRRTVAKGAIDEPVTLRNLWRVRRNPWSYRDNLVLADEELQIQEIGLFKRAGGGTIVDMTLDGIGRDPRGDQHVSRATGINIISGAGFYVWTAHPPELREMSVQDIADVIIRDLTEGIGDTRVKAGVIGEVGTWDPIDTTEEKSLRAAARAQRATGAPMWVHLYIFSKWGLKVLDILEAEGADLSRVALCHLDCTLPDLDYHRAVADRGAYIEYDLFGAEWANDDWRAADKGIRNIPHMPSDTERIRAIMSLIEGGYRERILISQDVCTKTQLTSFGGYGYAHILENIVPLMLDLGVEEDQIRTMMERNPQRLLAWTSPTE